MARSRPAATFPSRSERARPSRSWASSGSGKTTLLHLISGLLQPDEGVVRYRTRDGAMRDLALLSEAERRALMRTDWGFVHQDAAQGLRMNVSAGGNIGERLMALGDRHYGRIL